VTTTVPATTTAKEAMTIRMDPAATKEATRMAPTTKIRTGATITIRMDPAATKEAATKEVTRMALEATRAATRMVLLTSPTNVMKIRQTTILDLLTHTVLLMILTDRQTPVVPTHTALPTTTTATKEVTRMALEEATRAATRMVLPLTSPTNVMKIRQTTILPHTVLPKILTDRQTPVVPTHTALPTTTTTATKEVTRMALEATRAATRMVLLTSPTKNVLTIRQTTILDLLPHTVLPMILTDRQTPVVPTHTALPTTTTAAVAAVTVSSATLSQA